MEKGNFANLNQLKQVFNSVDYVGNDRYVFNIAGNKYRLIAMIHFNIRTVYILFAGTHGEYDRVDAKNISYKK
ncbi:MAG: type II toxin-antitoxin system HigB family toxin [Bacteroidota bacterium]|nr:type II toxin-antitoxin system HigB family toxin [Bacteroidota bacterium]